MSRRNWLRSTALTATGAAVLPSLLNSCIEDHRIPPGGGLGGTEELTPEQLQKAAQNVLRMNDFITDVYILTSNYEDTVLEYLKAGDLPDEWKDFGIGILVAIGIGIAGAVAAFVETVTAGVAGAGIAAVVAIVGEAVKKMEFEETPPNLDFTFGKFKDAHLAMQKDISDMLIILADAGDNHRNLRDKFKNGDLTFNCKSYSLKELAESEFPQKKDSDDTNSLYVQMRSAAYLDFEKSVWRYMLIKAGELRASFILKVESQYPPHVFARGGYYKDYKNGYTRGVYLGEVGDGKNHIYEFGTWYFRVGGHDLSDAAAKKLFKDDTPGHIINQEGLFNRDYVYKQFHREKPVFDRHDVRSDEKYGSNGGDAYGFALPDDFEFTGGVPKQPC